MEKEKPDPEEKAPGTTQPTPSPPKELIIDIYTPKQKLPPTNGKGNPGHED